eukprot:GHUV01010117.1.p1 GENE.GHUV01010117.1~~GHUV01010117.1.p1  ORF type:complete len:537 (+),score=147.08 GHUV01010117.1:220-1830(+)
MADDVPDFERFFGNKALSDVELHLYEEADTLGKRKRDEGLNLPCHSMVLVAYSGYCRTKIESWDSVSSSGATSIAVRQIDMSVPVGQLDVGQQLLKGMYQRTPDLNGISQTRLLQLLILADRYEVPKIVKAVGRCLQQVSTADLEWDVVTAVYSLPAGCADMPAYSSIFAAAATKLQAELGDLELVWLRCYAAQQPGSKQQLLCSLPYAAIKQLLKDDRTRVTSENTVFHTIAQWHKAQEPSPSSTQLKELLQLIRLQHCTQLFVATVISESSLAEQCFTAAELRLACAYSSHGCEAHGSGADVQLAFSEGKHPVLNAYPAWTAEPRPKSSLESLQLSLIVPLTKLREFGLHIKQRVQQQSKQQQQQQQKRPQREEQQQHQGNASPSSEEVEAEDDTAAALVCSQYGAYHVWQGRQLLMGIHVATCDQDTDAPENATHDSSMPQAASMRIQTFLGASCYEEEYLTAHCTFTVLPVPSRKSKPVAMVAGYSEAEDSWYMPMLGNFRSWEEAKQMLQQKGLVHVDGCVHFHCSVTKLV